MPRRTTNSHQSREDLSTEFEYKVLRYPLDQRELENHLNLYGKAGWQLSVVWGAFMILCRCGTVQSPKRVAGRRPKNQKDEARYVTDPLPDPSYEVPSEGFPP